MGFSHDNIWHCYECRADNPGWHWKCPICGIYRESGSGSGSGSGTFVPIPKTKVSSASASSKFTSKKSAADSPKDGPFVPFRNTTVSSAPTSRESTSKKDSADSSKDTPFTPFHDTTVSSAPTSSKSTSNESAADSPKDRTSFTHPDISFSGHELPEDDHSTRSICSSPGGSVVSIFSSNSIASTATALSKASGYSATQIMTALRELVSIFQHDQVLQPLYAAALVNPVIGPDRLERNLRRLLKIYAEQLKAEAADHQEFLAAQLVRMKARGLAKSIIEIFHAKSALQQIRDISQGNDSSGEEEEADELPISEEAFADLVTFREFLVGSRAFETLQENLQTFVFPANSRIPTQIQSDGIEQFNEPTLPEILTSELNREGADFGVNLKIDSRRTRPFVDDENGVRTWPRWRHDVIETTNVYLRNLGHLPITLALCYLIVDFIFLVTDGLMIFTAHLEPPLRPNHTWLRWSCKCGDAFFGDVQELRPGGITELAAQMENSSDIKVTVSPYKGHVGNQQYIKPRPDRWIRNGVSRLWSAFTGFLKPSPSLPHHNAPAPVNLGSTPGQNSNLGRSLYLMACMHRDRARKFVQQDRLSSSVATDQDLLVFLREQFVRHRGRILNMLRLKRVKGIHFVKFKLPMGGSVEIRQNDQCATSCECMPPLAMVEPPASAEYVCSPVPPAVHPPITPGYLAMLMYCPSEAHKYDTWIFNQLPKRTSDRQLQGSSGQPAQGWGIYYQEGWDRDLITLVIFIVLVAATLLFGVLWSIYNFDIQSAFSVSAWVATMGGILISLLVSRLDNTV